MSFLTKETFQVLGFNISTLILTLVVLFILIYLLIKFKKAQQDFLKIAFFTLTLIAFVSALFLALTGEFLFAQNNVRIIAFIAMAAFAKQLKDSEIFKQLIGKN